MVGCALDCNGAVDEFGEFVGLGTVEGETV